MMLSKLFLGLLVLTQIAFANTKHDAGTSSSPATASGPLREAAAPGPMPANISSLLSTITPYDAKSAAGKAVQDFNFPKMWDAYKAAPAADKASAAAPFVALILSTNETDKWKTLVPTLKAEQEKIFKTEDKPACNFATFMKTGGEAVAGEPYKYDDTTNKDFKASVKEDFKNKLLPEIEKKNKENAEVLAASDEFNKTGNPISQANKEKIAGTMGGLAAAYAACKTEDCKTKMSKLLVSGTSLDAEGKTAVVDLKNGKGEPGRMYMAPHNKQNPGQLWKDAKALLDQAGDKVKDWIFTANLFPAETEIKSKFALDQNLITNFKHPGKPAGGGQGTTTGGGGPTSTGNSALASNSAAGGAAAAAAAIRQVKCNSCHDARSGGPKTAADMVAMINRNPTKKATFLKEPGMQDLFNKLSGFASQNL